jgi:hypothetical protein
MKMIVKKKKRYFTLNGKCSVRAEIQACTGEKYCTFKEGNVRYPMD